METIRSIFFAFLSELFFMLVAISVKEDKKKMLIILSVGTILSGIIGFSPKISNQPTSDMLKTATPEVFPTYTQATSPNTIPVSTNYQVATIKPSPAIVSDPETFIKNYFDTLNNKNFEEAYSMLSNAFQANHPYNEYVSFWGTEIEKVEILSITIKSQNTSQVLIYVETRYYRKDYVTTGHTTYKLIKDGNSWLIDPN